jgi:UPF0042 nucleotide-binding protein
MKLIIISGRSGAGKSIALHILEDLGYYCIDNLPSHLLTELKEKLKSYEHIAVSIDARNISDDPEQLSQTIQDLKNFYQNMTIFFLDATDNTLLKRFSETRRKHPLTNPMTDLKEALQTEHNILKPVMNYTDIRIDTSHLTVHDLRKSIYTYAKKEDSHLSVLLQSFGYKNGIPLDTDFAFDVRCLPNPHWEKYLKHQTGLDQAVIDFLDGFQTAITMYDMIKQFIETWLPSFKAENRSYLSIAIGCTGGQHRSVYLTEKLGQYFLKHHKNVSIRHRDLVVKP